MFWMIEKKKEKVNKKSIFAYVAMFLLPVGEKPTNL